MGCHFLNGIRDGEGMPTAYYSRLVKITKAGSFKYSSTRNNNFTNRSHKGVINVSTGGMSTGAIVGIVVGSVVGVAALGGLGFALATGKIGSGFGASRV